MLFDTNEWSFEAIEKAWNVIDEIACEMGFDYYRPQIELISSEQMLQAYSTVAMPIMYSHWSFGKSFIQNEQAYKGGKMGLAYEVVINTDPCLVYLMEDNCVDADTEYLSETGWKKITEYEGGNVLGYNEDGTASFVSPKKYVVSKVTAPMVKIQSMGVDQLVTKKHRVIYKKRNGELAEILAEDLQEQHENLKRGWDGKIITSFELSSAGELSLSDDQIRLMCAVHADGHFPTEGTYCRFTFKKSQKVNRLCAILDRLDMPYRISNKNVKGTVHISCHPPLRSKTYDSYWWKASKEQLEVIADEVFYWDADLKRNNAYYSANKGDVDFIQYACAATNKCATIRKMPSCHSVIKSNRTLRTVRNVSEELREKAYCFEMPSGMWVARRNGKIFITGNTMVMQTLVMAHAGVGHSHFFKNNYMFKEWTDAGSILAYLKFARNYISSCEEKYGAKDVEMILDACHAIKYYGVDKYKRMGRKAKKEKYKRREQWLKHKEQTFNDLWRTAGQDAKWSEEKYDAIIDKLSKESKHEENLLYFIEKNSPILKDWEREIVRIVRKVSQYFYPQMQTSLMNEGFACYTHYMLMQELWERGHISEGHYIEFLSSHTAVVAQPFYNSEYYGGINVYALGFAMMMDIHRMCINPDEEDKKLFPDICNTDPLTTIKDIVATYRDESFVQQFLSPKVAQKFKLFALRDDANYTYMDVIGVEDADDLVQLRASLSKHYSLTYKMPQIEVDWVDWTASRELYLKYRPVRGKALDEEMCKKVLENIDYLWGYRVHMEEE